MKIRGRGQSTMEVTVLIIIVAAAFIAMQGYLGSSIQGNWKSNASAFSDEQYDPDSTNKTVETFDVKDPTTGQVLLSRSEPTILIKGSRVIVNRSGGGRLGSYDVSNGRGNLRIGGWGQYEGN